MRVRGRRFLRGMAQGEAAARIETRDGLLYDINHTRKTCRVKVGPEGEYLITARFPANWAGTPEFLKPGTAVRITHVSGVRNSMEVTGFGRTIPQGVENPMEATPVDAVIEGMTVEPFLGIEVMGVWVRVGTYRIDGVLYELEAVTIGGDEFYIGARIPLGSVGAALEIDPVTTASRSRYDLIVIDDTGAVSVVKGSAVTGEPVMPAVPDGKLLLGWVLVRYGQEFIGWDSLNIYWQTGEPMLLAIALQRTEMAWGVTTSTVTVSVLDQFGLPCIGSGDGWEIILAITDGNGTVSFPGQGSSTTSIKGYTGTNEKAIFTYTRGGVGPVGAVGADVSPTLTASMALSTAATVSAGIRLYDVNGDAMLGQAGGVSVPDVVDMTQAAATTAITNAGLVLGLVASEYSAVVAAGKVIRQSPTAGSFVAQGTSVHIVVSLGPLP